MDQNKESNITKIEMMPEKPVKKRPVFLILLLIILVCALGYLGYTYYDLKNESEIHKAEFDRQKTALEGELMNIYGQYDSLKSENDTMNQKLVAEQENIERLLKVKLHIKHKLALKIYCQVAKLPKNIKSVKSREFFLTWVSRLINWRHQPGVFLLVRTPLWICGWIQV